MNVYLEANFTDPSCSEGSTASFIIDHEFDSYAGEIQFFFFSATESSPNTTESKPGSFSITACRNDDQPLFYIEHYKWEWTFIESLPYSCDSKDDVQIKITATNGGSRTVIRVDAILIFEMQLTPEPATDGNFLSQSHTGDPRSTDYLMGESNQNQDRSHLTLILSVALAVTGTMFLCTLIITAILLCDHRRLLPDAPNKPLAHVDTESSSCEGQVKGIGDLQCTSRDVPDGASPDTCEVIWNRTQMESAEEEFVELKDAFPPSRDMGLGDSEWIVADTEVKPPKSSLESEAIGKLPPQYSGQTQIGHRPGKKSKVIAHPEAAFKVDIASFEGKVDFVGNPIYQSIPSDHPTKTGDGHSSRGEDGKNSSRKDDVWFGLGITFYRNKAADEAGLSYRPLGHQLEQIPEEPEYAAHIFTNSNNDLTKNAAPVAVSSSVSTANVVGIDTTESNC